MKRSGEDNMRIISGTAKGTKLYTLEGISTRPTLDRVKESIFNIIFNDIEDAIVLDLFSGSGAIGLEFASRGAKKVYLCDSSKEACKIIRKNIEKTHLGQKIELYNLDFIEAINKFKNQKFDIIYLDPPYKTDFIKIKWYNVIYKIKEAKQCCVTIAIRPIPRAQCTASTAAVGSTEWRCAPSAANLRPPTATSASTAVPTETRPST